MMEKPKMKSPDGVPVSEITAEQAAEVVQKEKDERSERCNKKIEKDLEEDNCRIDIIEIRRNGQLERYEVQVVAL